jgi:photosystem II stability/assembly factor-like uncharacterized protein
MNWSEIENGLTGSVQVLAFDPVNTDIILAGTSDAGLFRTLDGGINWSSIGSSTLPSDGAISIAIAAVQPQTVYLGTLSNGVFKSTDGGLNWMPVNNVEMTTIGSIAIDPANTDVVYVADSNESTGRSQDHQWRAKLDKCVSHLRVWFGPW